MSDKKYNDEILKLLQLGAEAYAEKNYELSVELYSEACEKSNVETGQDDPDLLYLYGKSLYENAVSKNGVLGSSTAAASEKSAKAQNESSKNESGPGEKDGEKGMFQFNEQLAEEDDDDEQREDEEEEDDDDDEATPPIQEEEDEEENNEDKSDEQTDFEVAWEILDLTRTIFQEKLDEVTSKLDDFEKEKISAIPYLKSDSDKEIKAIESPVVSLKRKLAEVYDLLGDISLETENFKQATQDLNTLVKLRTELYPFKSGLVTEAYYKLSLALEFYTDDLKSIPRAIEAMENTVKSIKERAADANEKDVDPSLVTEMELRLSELKKGDEKIKAEKAKIMEGILGQIATPADADSKPAVAVNDLTSMVKKRKPKDSAGRKNGKRVKKAVE
ncbi:unnamed protein product [Ambrosiozyma monospora]|uniref:Unnamed protein product n=1 Tax=Ambrosiozyma monospora TaxID=43982 RepID=A0A9W6Z0P8_AMBMO|nr:unnamed protein product [Ambrosiozyma monospora]